MSSLLTIKSALWRHSGGAFVILGAVAGLVLRLKGFSFVMFCRLLFYWLFAQFNGVSAGTRRWLAIVSKTCWFLTEFVLVPTWWTGFSLGWTVCVLVPDVPYCWLVWFDPFGLQKNRICLPGQHLFLVSLWTPARGGEDSSFYLVPSFSAPYKLFV